MEMISLCYTIRQSSCWAGQDGVSVLLYRLTKSKARPRTLEIVIEAVLNYNIIVHHA